MEFKSVDCKNVPWKDLYLNFLRTQGAWIALSGDIYTSGQIKTLCTEFTNALINPPLQMPKLRRECDFYPTLFTDILGNGVELDPF